MTVKEVLDLAKIRLVNVPVSKTNASLIALINLGVSVLYDQFNLSIKSETIATSPDLSLYELRNSDLTTEGYISRNQVESGSVEIDIDTLLMAVEDGNLENPVMNEYITNLVLQHFQLQLTSVSPIL